MQANISKLLFILFVIASRLITIIILTTTFTEFNCHVLWTIVGLMAHLLTLIALHCAHVFFYNICLCECHWGFSSCNLVLWN